MAVAHELCGLRWRTGGTGARGQSASGGDCVERGQRGRAAARAAHGCARGCKAWRLRLGGVQAGGAWSVRRRRESAAAT